jgi:nucleotide-binding universal stress UspA family protein
MQMSANRNILVAVDDSEASDRAVDGGLSDGKR